VGGFGRSALFLAVAGRKIFAPYRPFAETRTTASRHRITLEGAVAARDRAAGDAAAVVALVAVAESVDVAAHKLHFDAFRVSRMLGATEELAPSEWIET